MRTHCSSSELPIVPREAPQVDPGERFYASRKPAGLWYEVEGDWRRWLRDDGQDAWAAAAPYLHRVDLGSERIVGITSAADLLEFTRTYGVEPYGGAPRGYLSSLDVAIDWWRVAQAFDGIEIAPYLWECRLEVMWYYGWDCASGVIWRPRGVTVTYERQWWPEAPEAPLELLETNPTRSNP